MLQTDLQVNVQVLKATEMLFPRIGSDYTRSRSVIDVTSEVVVLNHQHPRLTALDKPKTEGFTQRVAEFSSKLSLPFM